MTRPLVAQTRSAAPTDAACRHTGAATRTTTVGTTATSKDAVSCLLFHIFFRFMLVDNAGERPACV